MKKLLLTLLCSAAVCAHAQTEISVPMSLLDAEKGDQAVGQVRITQSKYGAVFTPVIEGLAPGIYGFHIHENASCAPLEKDGKLTAGLAAGGHWDPKKTGAHKGPWDDGGHLGDLPALAVDGKGVIQPVVAPRIKKIRSLHNRALMIHAGGDNYSDHPAALGGGGARKYCGVISAQ